MSEKLHTSAQQAFKPELRPAANLDHMADFDINNLDLAAARQTFEEGKSAEAQEQNAKLGIYNDNRPYKDKKGRAHSPAKGSFINADKYFDGQRQFAEEGSNEAYEDMSISKLAKKLAGAEFHNDQTSTTNISEALIGKLANFEGDIVEKHNRHDTDMNNEMSDNLWDRVMGLKDRELTRLQEGGAENPDDSTTEDEKPGTDVVPFQPGPGTDIVPFNPRDKLPVPGGTNEMDVIPTQPELGRVIAQLRQARSEYARIAATRGSRTVTGRGKEFDKDALETAKKHYEALVDQQFLLELSSARAAKITGNDCERLAGVSAMIDASRLAKEIKRHEQLATGEYREVTDRNGRVRMGADGLPAVEKIVREGKLEKAGLAVKEFWARNTGGKFFSRKTAKKVAATVAAGIPLGIAAGLAGSVLLGPAAAGAIGVVAATRISKFLASNQLNKYSDSAKAAQSWDNVINDYDGDRLKDGNGINFDTERWGVSDKVEFGSNLRVKRNRLRAGGMAVSLVAGSLVGHAAEHLLSTIGGGDDHTEALSSGNTDASGAGTQTDLGKMPSHPAGSGDHHPHGGSHSTPEKPKFEHLSLEHNGDNIWNEVKEHMDAQGYKTDNEHLDKIKDAILRHQGITEDQARYLPVGYDFGIPLDVLHSIPKK